MDLLVFFNACHSLPIIFIPNPWQLFADADFFNNGSNHCVVVEGTESFLIRKY